MSTTLRCVFCALSSAMLATLIVTLVNAQDLPAPAPAPAPIPGNDALSAPLPGAGQKNVKTKVVYKEKSYYDFEDVLINGNLRKPDGSFIFRKNTTPFSSALNLRRSFIPELKESSTNTR